MSQFNSIAVSAGGDPSRIYGTKDSTCSYPAAVHMPEFSAVKVGIVEQFNVGMYSALVKPSDEQYQYTCYLGTFNATPGFGYSDSLVLHEGEEVLFLVTPGDHRTGFIVAKKPTEYSVDDNHPVKVEDKEKKLDRRTHFFSNDCYRKKCPAYDTPLKTPNDTSTGRDMCNRPTDLVPGEYGSINPHRNGILHSMYSTSLVGGGACIRMFSLENRIRVVADSIVKHTLFGNDQEWHNRRYLSRERAACLYQEERLGMKSKEAVAFEKAKYDDEFYFIKNKKKRQTLKPRILEQEGFFGGLTAKYHLRPDPDGEEPRTMDEKEVKDPGVARESVDPSGQYRFAATGMIGSERIGRIPVPIRIRYPWHKDAEEPKPKQLKEFQHDEDHPYYRQLELADRVAYDVKNSYARLDEAKTEFYVPEEQDLDSKLKDTYDPGFTDSTTVKLQKYDKRRSGIWQGEDGSIILRDAWGSEIVMIGGNIQLSCAGNVEILPGKTALTLAGDDVVIKAQNSVDVESADKDVRINAVKNVQIMAGIDDKNPGGVTIETKGEAGPWDATKYDGGEKIGSTGIFLKAHGGSVVTDTKYSVLRSTDVTSLVSGKKKEDEDSLEGGTIALTSGDIHSYSRRMTDFNTDKSSVILMESASVVGENVFVASRQSTGIFQKNQILIPLEWADGDYEPAAAFLDGLVPLIKLLSDEVKIAMNYGSKDLEKMMFKFRSSAECDTEESWELDGSRNFTLFQPFWVQVRTKFETLKNVRTKGFEDHKDVWPEETGNPWPGRTAATSLGMYAKLESDSPVNMDDQGFNKKRDDIQPKSTVIEVDLFSESGYQIREY